MFVVFKSDWLKMLIAFIVSHYSKTILQNKNAPIKKRFKTGIEG